MGTIDDILKKHKVAGKSSNNQVKNTCAETNSASKLEQDNNADSNNNSDDMENSSIQENIPTLPEQVDENPLDMDSPAPPQSDLISNILQKHNVEQGNLKFEQPVPKMNLDEIRAFGGSLPNPGSPNPNMNFKPNNLTQNSLNHLNFNKVEPQNPISNIANILGSVITTDDVNSIKDVMQRKWDTDQYSDNMQLINVAFRIVSRLFSQVSATSDPNFVGSQEKEQKIPHDAMLLTC
jgi:hypothetical protein